MNKKAYTQPQMKVTPRVLCNMICSSPDEVQRLRNDEYFELEDERLDEEDR